MKVAKDVLPWRTGQLREATKSILELPYPWRTAEGVCSVMWGRKRLTVDQLRRDKAAPVSSSKGTQTPSSSTVHVLKDARAELTECMGVGADELATACRGPVRGPSTDGAERQTLAKWLSLPQDWQTFPLAGHVGALLMWEEDPQLPQPRRGWLRVWDV